MGAASRPSGRIVEFIGIAGAGKSTICNFAREEFLRAGIRAVDAPQVLNHIRNDGVAPWLIARLGRPSRSKKRLRRRFNRIRARALENYYQRFPDSKKLVEERLALMRAISPGEADLVAPWLTSKMGNFELMHQMRGDWSLCFWEEGIALRSINLFALVAEAGEPDGVEQFLRNWPLPDALVHVEVSMDTAYSRMQQRGRTKRLLDASEEDVRRFLSRSERVVSAIATEARRRTIPVFTIDNDKQCDPLTPALEGWAECSKGLTQLTNEN